MTTNSDLSGIHGPRLGLGHDSGWGHLSGTQPTHGEDMSGLDFDEIAAQAASEVFGRAGGGGHPFVRGAYAAGRASTRGLPGHPYMRAAYRAGRAAGAPGYSDYYRAGWGAPGWDAGYSEGAPVEGGSYEDPAIEDQELAEEAAALSDDGEEGYDGGEGYGDDEEFGRFGRKRRQARRQRRRARRQHRRAGWGSPGWDSSQMDASREPLGGGYEEEPEPSYIFEEEEYAGYDPQHWHGRRGGPVVAQEEAYGRYGQYTPGRWHGRRGGPVVAAEESYGDLPVSAPSQEKPSTFRTSLETGLGVGLGFMGAVAAVTLVARAFSGRR